MKNMYYENMAIVSINGERYQITPDNMCDYCSKQDFCTSKNRNRPIGTTCNPFALDLTLYCPLRCIYCSNFQGLSSTSSGARCKPNANNTFETCHPFADTSNKDCFAPKFDNV